MALVPALRWVWQQEPLCVAMLVCVPCDVCVVSWVVSAVAVYGGPAVGTGVAVTRGLPRGHLRGVFPRYSAIPS